jgi:putative addiction module CopG family antidote
LTPEMLAHRLEPMDVRLNRDQEQFIRRAIENGGYGKAEDVVREALAMLEERERKRMELLEAVDFTEISISRAAGGNLPQQPTTEPSAQGEPHAKVKRGSRARKRTAAARA